MVERYIRRDPPGPGPEVARGIESRATAINPPKRFHRQILRRPRVPDDPKNPTVNLPLELSKQCFESFELPLREPLQEFHLLFSTISY